MTLTEILKKGIAGGPGNFILFKLNQIESNRDSHRNSGMHRHHLFRRPVRKVCLRPAMKATND